MHNKQPYSFEKTDVRGQKINKILHLTYNLRMLNFKLNIMSRKQNILEEEKLKRADVLALDIPAVSSSALANESPNDAKPMLPAVYSMNLHETITVAEDVLVTRVPGGWIYEFQKPQANILEIVFVPFNNEFQK